MSMPKRAPRTGTRRREGGFTLLELLVVIFIMLAMTGIAVAAFRQFMDTERIKLAGGQVVSAIGLARQYAMSKRSKVMVEFGPSPPVLTKTYALAAVARAQIVSGDGKSATACGSGLLRLATGYQSQVLLRFDLSSIPSDALVISATLKMTFDNSGGYTYKPQTLDARNTVSGWDPATVTFATAPASGTSFGTVYAEIGAREILMTAKVADEIRAGTPLLAFRLLPSGYGWQYYGLTLLTATLEVQTAEYQPMPEGTVRNVRILPYLRMRDQITGGFTWLLDQDSCALRTIELPRNISYVLAPPLTDIEQYDPGDVDQKSTVRKVYFDLMPDGSCVARPPNVVGWSNQANTLILRDGATGDVALLFVPPSSSFTRQRYLFGTEVDSFVAAHSLYSLW